MPATKSSAKKKPIKKPTAKKKLTQTKKTSPIKKPKLVCGVCGYSVIVDNVCGCAEEHTLICCGKPMAKK